MPESFTDPAALAQAVVRRVGKRVVLGLPLNLSLPRIGIRVSAIPVPALGEADPEVAPPTNTRRVAMALSFVFASTLFVSAGVSWSLPLPCTSVSPAHVSRGGVAVLPDAVRQAPFVPLLGTGSVTVPVPSTVRSLKRLSNNTVPVAEAP